METIIQTIPTVNLQNGMSMPLLGLGVLKAQNGFEVEHAVDSALQNGYSLIDTAAAYRNEEGVGQAIRLSGIPREDIFLTTKVWNSDQGYEATLKAFEKSLDDLGTHYIDLYLIHWPVAGKYKETWRALETLYKQGKVNAIGVSNFQIHHLQDLMQTAEIKPMVNQVEVHPHLQQEALLQFAQKHDIILEAWRPLMMGEVKDIALFNKLGSKYQKSPFQVALRWLTQRGIVAIPKSVKMDRIIQNSDIFDFDLTQDEMNEIAKLDQHRRLGPDPDNFNF